MPTAPVDAFNPSSIFSMLSLKPTHVVWIRMAHATLTKPLHKATIISEVKGHFPHVVIGGSVDATSEGVAVVGFLVKVRTLF